MKLGDLIMFVWPDGENYDYTIRDSEWENARLGLVVKVMVSRPDDMRYGDELLVLHDGERWSVPSRWCRHVKESE